MITDRNYLLNIKDKELPRSQTETMRLLCSTQESCYLALALSIQSAIVLSHEINDLGTLLAEGAETLLAGTFHTSLMFQENRYLLEQDLESQKM